MEKIKKKYILDKKKRLIAVQVDIATFERIEQLLEDYALGQLMNDNDPDGYLTIEEARELYNKSIDEHWLVVKFHKNFLKDLENIPLKERKRIELFVFHEIPQFEALHEIPKLDKLKGYRNYYKIRFGNYRLGLRYSNNTLYIERLLHRKEIYRYYP